MRNAQQRAVLDGDGTHLSEAWGINGTWSPAATTGIALDGSQVHWVWKSGGGEHWGLWKDGQNAVPPYKDPQDPLKCLEALDTDVIILNADLAHSADPVSPVVMVKLMDNPETVPVIHGEVEPV